MYTMEEHANWEKPFILDSRKRKHSDQSPSVVSWVQGQRRKWALSRTMEMSYVTPVGIGT